MKKISFVLAALFAVAACSKSNVVEHDSLVSIPVTVESIVSPTKSSIVVDGDKFTPSITDGDIFAMMVNDKSTNMNKFSYSKSTNSISGTYPTPASTSTTVRYMVVSNSDAGGAGSAAAYSRFKIDDKQTNNNGEFGRNLVLLGVSDECNVESEDKPSVINFKTMCSLLEFDVKNGVEDKTYLDSIKVESLGGEQIAGRFAISKTYKEDWMDSYAVDPNIKDEDKSSSVTLGCGGVEITETSAPFYVSCAFGTLSQGLKISFFVNHGDVFQTTIEKTIGKSGLTLQRNTLYQIPTSISDKIIVHPVLSFDTTEFNDVSSEGDILTVNYTVANPIDGETISATSDASWVNTFDYSTDGELLFVVDANEGIARTATITVAYKNALPVTITVSQAKSATQKEQYSVTYTVLSSSKVTTSGTAPDGSSATFKNTYSTKDQLTEDKSQTYTLSGYTGKTIKKVVLSMKSNTNSGKGTFSLKAGDQTLAAISSATAFNKWYDNTSYTTSYKDVTVDLTNDSYQIQSGENVVLVIAATVNSLYCQSVTITYE